MTATTLNYTATVTIENCIDCGGPIALTSAQKAQLKRSHQTFYCAMGHSQIFVGESDTERAKRLADELEAQKRMVDEWRKYGDDLTDRLNAERKSHATTKGQLTRTRKRIQHGVCPECNRTFKQLAAHMKAKHPEQSQLLPHGKMKQEAAK